MGLEAQQHKFTPSYHMYPAPGAVWGDSLAVSGQTDFKSTTDAEMQKTSFQSSADVGMQKSDFQSTTDVEMQNEDQSKEEEKNQGIR